MFSTQDTHNGSYGFFVGYNSQWDQVVLGIELNYNRTSLQASQSSTFSRIISPGDGFNYHTTVDALALQRITDYGTLRARAGYIMEGFMPYATVGIAVGRADINRTATVRAEKTLPQGGGVPDLDLGPLLIQPPSDGEVRTKFIYGYAAGVGLEAAILPNIFVRGEYEFLQFGPFSDMRANINAIRLGGGVRF
jgi:opacity protein-like surface antigen